MTDEKAEAISNLTSNISNLNTAYLEKSGVIMTFAYLSGRIIAAW
jgi:hypothetical protein